MNRNEKRQLGVARFSFVPQSGSHPQGHRYHSPLYVRREAPQAPIHQLPWHHLEEKAQRQKKKKKEGKTIVATLPRNAWFHNLHVTADTRKVEHFGKMNQVVMFLLWDPLQEGRPSTSWRPSSAIHHREVGCPGQLLRGHTIEPAALTTVLLLMEQSLRHQIKITWSNRQGTIFTQ